MRCARGSRQRGCGLWRKQGEEVVRGGRRDGAGAAAGGEAGLVIVNLGGTFATCTLKDV